MSVTARFLVCIMVVLGSTSAHAADLPPFDGQTKATLTTKYGALGVISQLLHDSLGCSVVDHVASRPLAHGDAIPASISLPRMTPPVTWERWTVTACQKERPFVVAFWPSKYGAYEFRVAQEKSADS